MEIFMKIAFETSENDIYAEFPKFLKYIIGPKSLSTFKKLVPVFY